MSKLNPYHYKKKSSKIQEQIKIFYFKIKYTIDSIIRYCISVEVTTLFVL